MMFRTGVVWTFLIFGMSGCTFKATTDTTTDGTTEFLVFQVSYNLVDELLGIQPETKPEHIAALNDQPN